MMIDCFYYIGYDGILFHFLHHARSQGSGLGPTDFVIAISV